MAKAVERSLAEELERFVKEEAQKFGEVISYVPVASNVSSQTGSSVTPNALTIEHHGFAELTARLEPLRGEGWTQADSLEVLNTAIQNCQKCDLWQSRKQFVFGTGNPNAKLMIIGEAPGADEDEKGVPFVGRAGQLLTKMLEAINFTRDELFICNILKSRPPNNRDPKPDEVAACEPYLWKQILLIRPKFILCLGRIAGTNLLKIQEPLGKMRGNIYDFYGTQVIVTYHPAALLRNPDWKHGAWEDLKKLRRMYDEAQE
jgi:uracil-DNA glycosylase family 4